jgi:Uma2 family endonuclease
LATSALIHEPRAVTPARRSEVVIEDRVRIPSWVVDLDSFRRWFRSDAYPRAGRASWLAGEIWIETGMERRGPRSRKALAAVKPPESLPTSLDAGPDILIDEVVRIPGWVVDLESFRCWARSDSYPPSGWFSFLHGQLWVDLSMEELFTHNLIKTEFTITLGGLVKSASLGYFCSDRMLLTNSAADLSTEPDALFASWDALQSGRLQLVKGAKKGYVELEGTPDMVLEVVSASSVRKDTKDLHDQYWRAGVPEYWLVDVRRDAPRFEILRHGRRSYVATRKQGGWTKSSVFNRSFRLTQETDPLGHPAFTLAVQPEPSV